MLNAETVLVGVRRVQVRIDEEYPSGPINWKESCRSEIDIFGWGLRRERIWIAKKRLTKKRYRRRLSRTDNWIRANASGGEERRLPVELEVIFRFQHVVENPASAADARLAIVPRIPGKADSRCKVV